MPITTYNNAAIGPAKEGYTGGAAYASPICDSNPPEWFGDVTGQYVSMISITSKNDPDHRKKPEFLIDYPTSLAYQFRFVARNGHCATGPSGASWYMDGPQYLGLYKGDCVPMTAYFVTGALHSYPILSGRNDGAWTGMLNACQMPSDLWSLPLRSQIKNLSLNIAEDVFEYRETCRLFHETVKELWNLYQAVKHPDKLVKEVRRVVRKANGLTRKVRVVSTRRVRTKAPYGSKTVAKAFIATEFGVLPLMSDLSDAARRLNDSLGTTLLKRLCVTPSFETEVSIPVNYSGHRDGVRSMKWKRSQRAVVYVWLSTAHKEITFGNPAELLYNLTAFSFMLDWFVPIGQWLGSLDALAGVQKTLGTVTTRDTIRWKDTSHPDNFDRVFRPQEAMEIGSSRDVITSIPIPPFPTSYRPSSSYEKVAIGLGLLGSMQQSAYSKRAT